MRRIAALLAIACVACEESEPIPDDITRDQNATLGVQLRQLEMLTSQYGERIAVATDSTCISTHRTYNLDARMILFGIRLVDTELDAAIVTHSGDGYADIECTTNEIERELDYHGAVACQDATIELDRAEATRHLEALAALREHLLARSMEISAGLAKGSTFIDGKPPPWTFTVAPFCP
jgi:hypothetical protein